MIIAMVKCEICPNNFPVPDLHSRPYEYETPEGWITLVQGNPQTHVDQHFCSKLCLSHWVGAVSAELPEVQQPQSKMRRFLLIDGETAEEVEGIVWSRGLVALDVGPLHAVHPSNPHDFHCTGYFQNWDEFKQAHPGYGVLWIDREDEVSDEK